MAEVKDTRDRSGRIDRRTLPGQDQLPTKCNGTNREGQPCRRAPLLGGNVCATHGGRAPQVKRAADRRIAQAAAEVEARAILSNMPFIDLDAEPVRDPTVALGLLAARLGSGFEETSRRVNAAVEAGQEPSDKDLALLRILGRESRQILTDMTRLQIGVSLGMQFISKAAPEALQNGQDGALAGDQEPLALEGAPADLPDVSAIVAAVLKTEHELETERLVRLRQTESAAIGIPVVNVDLDDRAESA